MVTQFFLTTYRLKKTADSACEHPIKGLYFLLKVLVVKNSLANARDVKRHGFNPWVGIPLPFSLTTGGLNRECGLKLSCLNLSLPSSDYRIKTKLNVMACKSLQRWLQTSWLFLLFSWNFLTNIYFPPFPHTHSCISALHAFPAFCVYTYHLSFSLFLSSQVISQNPSWHSRRNSMQTRCFCLALCWDPGQFIEHGTAQACHICLLQWVTLTFSII